MELPHWGPYMGTILKRENDPDDDPATTFAEDDLIGRIKVSIPGWIEETAWAQPLGWGGSAQFGINAVPPIGADVAVFFPNGKIDRPLWIAGPPGRGEVFPEFVHPDVMVMGTESFRFVHDQREGQRFAALRVIKTIGDAEEAVVEVLFNIEENGLRVFCESALGLESGSLINADANGGDIQIRGRKVLPSSKPIQ